MELQWLIWSQEHHSWWRFAGVGYTDSMTDAGRFSFLEALRIVSDAHRGPLKDAPNETMIPDFGNLKTRQQINEMEHNARS